MNKEILFNPELTLAEDTLTATIEDAELDPLECLFQNDESVVINTSKLEYVILDLENLETLKELIIESRELYSSGILETLK
jgi:hypothetical protein